MFIIWWRTKQTDSVFPGQNFEVTCILVILSYCPVLCFFFFSKLLRTRTAEFLRLEANYMLEHHFQEIADIFRKCRQSGQCSCGSEVKGSGRLTPGCPSDKQDKWTLSAPKTSTRTVCFLLLQVSVWVHFGIMSVNELRAVPISSERAGRAGRAGRAKELSLDFFDTEAKFRHDGSQESSGLGQDIFISWISKRIYGLLFCSRHLITQASFAETCHGSTLTVQSQNQTHDQHQDLGSASSSPPPASLTGNNSSFHMDAHSSSASAE